jgi:hypothetical protein
MRSLTPAQLVTAHEAGLPSTLPLAHAGRTNAFLLASEPVVLATNASTGADGRRHGDGMCGVCSRNGVLTSVCTSTGTAYCRNIFKCRRGAGVNVKGTGTRKRLVLPTIVLVEADRQVIHDSLVGRMVQHLSATRLSLKCVYSTFSTKVASPSEFSIWIGRAHKSGRSISLNKQAAIDHEVDTYLANPPRQVVPAASAAGVAAAALCTAPATRGLWPAQVVACSPNASLSGSKSSASLCGPAHLAAPSPGRSNAADPFAFDGQGEETRVRPGSVKIGMRKAAVPVVPVLHSIVPGTSKRGNGRQYLHSAPSPSHPVTNALVRTGQDPAIASLMNTWQSNRNQTAEVPPSTP